MSLRSALKRFAVIKAAPVICSHLPFLSLVSSQLSVEQAVQVVETVEIVQIVKAQVARSQ
jgi:hypothetical protein